MTFNYTVTDAADASVRQQIAGPLVRFNESQAGPINFRPLAVILTDGEEKIVGGLWGGTAYGWLHIDLLVVPAQARGNGVGTRLMQLAEKEARSRECHSAWLDTHDFQARPFYERLGYVQFAELPDFPIGHSKIFLKKSLVA
ncbi:GNAT family N-acetyltransferase [Paraburkholderia bannensis]|uniref:GNAT family N-acetyltransferase n=1 Tax=Paraburkholderia bannensis TaxID=765414 RepID=UPI000A05B413|nr:GNAT family N-acetyltransferase [Paraburkholderia bannensis]